MVPVKVLLAEAPPLPAKSFLPPAAKLAFSPDAPAKPAKPVGTAVMPRLPLPLRLAFEVELLLALTFSCKVMHLIGGADRFAVNFIRALRLDHGDQLFRNVNVGGFGIALIQQTCTVLARRTVSRGTGCLGFFVEVFTHAIETGIVHKGCPGYADVRSSPDVHRYQFANLTAAWFAQMTGYPAGASSGTSERRASPACSDRPAVRHRESPASRRSDGTCHRHRAVTLYLLPEPASDDPVARWHWVSRQRSVRLRCRLQYALQASHPAASPRPADVRSRNAFNCARKPGVEALARLLAGVKDLVLRFDGLRVRLIVALRDDHVDQLFTHIDVRRLQRTCDVVALRFQTFRVREAGQYDLSQQLSALVGVTAGDGTVIVDGVAGQVARRVAVLCGVTKRGGTGVLLQAAHKVQGDGGTVCAIHTRNGHSSGVVCGFNEVQIKRVRVTLSVVHGDGVFSTVRRWVSRRELGVIQCCRRGVQLRNLIRRGGGIRRHLRGRDFNRNRARTGNRTRRVGQTEKTVAAQRNIQPTAGGGGRAIVEVLDNGRNFCTQTHVRAGKHIGKRDGESENLTYVVKGGGAHGAEIQFCGITRRAYAIDVGIIKWLSHLLTAAVTGSNRNLVFPVWRHAAIR
nr:Uncharacterised protein [Ipomoea batatas]